MKARAAICDVNYTQIDYKSYVILNYHEVVQLSHVLLPPRPSLNNFSTIQSQTDLVFIWKIFIYFKLDLTYFLSYKMLHVLLLLAV